MSYHTHAINLSIVILAAGKGTRMRSDLPKVLHTIAGKPMLKHVVETAKELTGNITVVIGHHAELIRSQFSDRATVQFVMQQQQLGTGHAVQQAIPKLIAESDSDMTLILYGDVPLVQPQTLQRLVEEAADVNGIGLLTEHLENPTGYGRIVRDSGGQIVRIVEQKDATDAELKIREVNTGILCAPTRKLIEWLNRLDNQNAQREYYLTDIIAFAVKDKIPVSAVHPDKPWETNGVNSRVQQGELERAWQLEQAKRLQDAGVTLMDPARFDLRGRLDCGRDVNIDINCIFEGDVELGDNVRIGPHCVIKDAKIEAGTVVNAYSHIDGSNIAESAVVGPYARLRPGTRLGTESHVGNFVELKKTTLGTRSKANHLTYLGDADIGKDVNVGAGTITCNYDGANKHKTTIKDNAFIGSGCLLIAPVEVGRGATLGAGTNLRKDAPDEQLTLTKSEELSKPSWKRPVKKTESQG